MSGQRGGASAFYGLPVLACCFLGCISSSAVMAPPKDSAPTYLWGIRKACKRDAYLSSAVEKRLFQMDSPTGGEVRRLLPGPTLDNAPPGKAAAEFRRNCRFDRANAPQSGVLLGGRVEERGAAPPFIVMRLFRVDLGTQEIAYRDHFCRGCDSARTLSTQAAYLLEAPGEPSAAPPSLPTFCTAAPPPPRTPIAPLVDGERVTVVMRNSDKRARMPGPGASAAAKLLEALRQHVSLTGRDVVPAGARYTLTVELTANGGAELYCSSRGGSGQHLTVERPPAAPGAVAEGLSESLIAQVVRAAGRILDDTAAIDVAAQGQAGPLFELPLSPPVYATLCQPRTGSECTSTGGTRLDSDPTLTQFFDPQCGEIITEEPAR